MGVLKSPRIVLPGYSIAATEGDNDPKSLAYDMARQLSYSCYFDGPWGCKSPSCLT